MKCCPNYIWNSIVNVPPDISPSNPQFTLLFNAHDPYGFGTDVAQWNAYYQSNFTSVTLNGNYAYFEGGAPFSINDMTGMLGSDGFLVGFYDYTGICDYIIGTGFQGCSALTTFYSPSLQEVFDSAFLNVSTLTSLYAPSVTAVYYRGFYGTSIQDVELPLCTYVDEGGFQATTGTGFVKLPLCTQLGQYAFSQSSYTLFSMDLVSSVGLGCFSGAQTSDIYLPSLIASSASMFSGCTNLVSVDLPICDEFSAPGSQLSNCDKLEYLNIPAMLNFGGTPANNNIFQLVNLTNPLVININASQQTIDAGSPDGDLVAVDSANPGLVTINYI